MTGFPVPIVIALVIALLVFALALSTAIRNTRRRTELACLYCGCTDSQACEGGCWWWSRRPPICSRCAPDANDGQPIHVKGEPWIV